MVAGPALFIPRFAVHRWVNAAARFRRQSRQSGSRIVLGHRQGANGLIDGLEHGVIPDALHQAGAPPQLENRRMHPGEHERDALRFEFARDLDQDIGAVRIAEMDRLGVHDESDDAAVLIGQPVDARPEVIGVGEEEWPIDPRHDHTRGGIDASQFVDIEVQAGAALAAQAADGGL